DSKTDQRAGEAAGGAADCGAGKSAEDGSSGNQWTQAGYRQSADAGEPAERAAEDGAGASAGGSALGSFGRVLVAEIAHAGAVGGENRDVARRESAGLEAGGDADGLSVAIGNGIYTGCH